MHSLENLGPRVIFGFGDQFLITETVVFTWILMVLLVVFSILVTKNLKEKPGKLQSLLELYVEMVYGMIEGAVGKRNMWAAPYFTSLFLFLIVGNALGLLGIRSITADVNTTFAIAIISFILIQGTAIKQKGLGGHIKHMSEPIAFLFPINFLSDVALPISLAFRLFGNILGGCIVIALCYTALGSLSTAVGLSIPIFGIGLPIALNFFFDVFEPILQAFVFVMLSITFLGVNAVQDEH